MNKRLKQAGLLVASALVLTGCKNNCLKMDPLDLSYGLPSNIQGTFAVTNTCKKNKDGKPSPVTGLEKQSFKSMGAFEILLDKKGKPPRELLSELEAAKVVYSSPKSYELNATLLLDLSGSISKSEKELDALKKAAIEFVNTATDANGRDIKIGIYTFDGRADIIPLVEHTNVKDKIIEKLTQISCSDSSINDYCVDPSTNLNGAVIEGAKISSRIARQTKKELSSHALIVFTDGTDQADRESHHTAKSHVSKMMIANGHKVMTVGVGTEIDKNRLRELGSSGSFFASERKKLTEVFQSVAKEIRDTASSVYTIRYCTAKRNRVQDLTFGVRDKSNYGYITGLSYDATGFEAGCRTNDESQWTEDKLLKVPTAPDRSYFRRSVSKQYSQDHDLRHWLSTYTKQKEIRLYEKREELRKRQEAEQQRIREERLRREAQEREAANERLHDQILLDVNAELTNLGFDVIKLKEAYINPMKNDLNYLKNTQHKYKAAKSAWWNNSAEKNLIKKYERTVANSIAKVLTYGRELKKKIAASRERLRQQDLFYNVNEIPSFQRTEIQKVYVTGHDALIKEADKLARIYTQSFLDSYVISDGIVYLIPSHKSRPALVKQPSIEFEQFNAMGLEMFQIN